MSARPALRPLAWGALAVALALAAASVVLLALTLDAPVPDNWGFRGYWALGAAVIGVPGLLVALRQPRNPIGWLLLVAAVASGYGGFAQEYATYALVAHPGSLPAAVPIAWVASWSFALFVTPLLVFIPLLFPDGRLLSPRWRAAVWAGIAMTPFLLLFFGLRPGPLENAAFIENPFGLQGGANELRIAVGTPFEAGFAAVSVLCAASLVVRFRRSAGIERQQLKWVALSGVLVVAGMLWVLATTPLTGTNTTKAAQVAMILAFGTMPAAIAIAMLRYRLYDVDAIINRALVYGALSAVVAASYVALVVVSQAIVRPVTGGSEIAVALSTLAVVGLVQPLRRRIQDAVDRRFYRSRYDAAHTLEVFASHLRDEVDLDELRADVVDVIGRTVAPRHASLWLKGERT